MFRRSRCCCSQAADSGHFSATKRSLQMWLWMRNASTKMILPFFLGYSLFVLRPQEAHWVRFIAEKRFGDPEFQKLFPDVVKEQPSNSSGASGRNPSLFHRNAQIEGTTHELPFGESHVSDVTMTDYTRDTQMLLDATRKGDASSVELFYQCNYFFSTGALRISGSEENHSLLFAGVVFVFWRELQWLPRRLNPISEL